MSLKITIVLPVLNEERVLGESIEKLARFVGGRLQQHEVTIVICDNGSTDGTAGIGKGLESQYGNVRYVRLERRGKGLAIREGWRRFPADVAVFMDADLATDLEALPDLVAAVAGGGADLAVGSRYHPASTVERSAARKFISRAYRLVLRSLLGTGVEDVPCGFKAASAGLVREIMPAIKDDGWFFDTELVVRTERAGKRIVEIPVRWCEFRTEGRQSKVRVFSLGLEYAKKSWALRSELARAKKKYETKGTGS